MSRRTITAAIATALLAAACGTAQGRGERAREVIRALDKSSDQSRAFSYVDETLDGRQRILVDGIIQDDFRVSGTVRLNGRPLYELVVSDDAVALRLLDLSRTKPVVKLAEAADAPTATALARGRWVVDYTAAPGLAARARSGREEQDGGGTKDVPRSTATLVGDDPFFDAAEAVQYAKRNVRESFVAQFNPEGINYNPADDPWRSDGGRNLDDEGIIRYDLGQPPLPARAGRGQRQQLPGVRHFRKMAIYVKAEEMIEVKEQISISDRREFRRALEGRTAQYYVRLRDAAKEGAVADPLRERKTTYTITRFGGGGIKVPQNAEKGILRDVVGTGGLKSLFHFMIVGGGGAPLIPGPLSSGEPTASPRASD